MERTPRPAPRASTLLPGKDVKDPATPTPAPTRIAGQVILVYTSLAAAGGKVAGARTHVRALEILRDRVENGSVPPAVEARLVAEGLVEADLLPDAFGRV